MSGGPAAGPGEAAGDRGARRGRVLVVDDQAANRRLLADLLQAMGHEVATADSGEAALAAAEAAPPDLILLDVLMPGLDGFEVCRRVRASARLRPVPVVLVTSLDARDERLRGLQAGADDFLSKPVDRDELRARVASLLRVKTLYDEVDRQREALAGWSRTLQQRVDDKLAEIARLSTLKRFFSPALAQRLVAGDGDELLRSHRREVTVLFADLRGFTAFAEAAAPEVVMHVLGEFHAAMGGLIFEAGGTLERFTGDGMMVFFNDPDPVPDHSGRAIALALRMAQATAALVRGWQALQGPAGIGLGVARGMATLGAIGFASRVDYAAIGQVTNLAARLCAEARAGELLVADEAWQAASPWRLDAGPGLGHHAEPVAGGLVLRGLARPVAAWRLTPAAAAG